MKNGNPLIIGDIYPSYRALCKHLGEPVKTGGAKINQLEHWQTCFLWEKQGNKYKITKIMKSLDQRPHMQRENSKWYKNIAILLLNKVADTIAQGCDNDGYNELVLTSLEAYIALGLCNGKFKSLKAEGVPEISNIPIEHRITFHKEATDKFYYILTNVLHSLESQAILTYTKTYRFTLEGKSGEIKLASLKEKTLIQEVVRELLDKFKLKSEYEVIQRHKESEFYKELKLLLEQKGFYDCFRVYCIGFTESCLPRFNDFIDNLETQTTAKIDINKKSYNDLLRKINTIDSKASNLDDHIAFQCNFNKLIDLTIPLTD